jgi:hypothetical protein
LRARLRASLHYPPPGFDPASAPKAEETPLGEDDIGTYAELRIPVLPGVQSTGLLVRPKTAHKGDRLPLVIAAAGRGGMPSASADGKLIVVRHSPRDIAWEALQHGYAVWMPTFMAPGAQPPRPQASMRGKARRNASVSWSSSVDMTSMATKQCDSSTNIFLPLRNVYDRRLRTPKTCRIHRANS